MRSEQTYIVHNSKTRALYEFQFFRLSIQFFRIVSLKFRVQLRFVGIFLALFRIIRRRSIGRGWSRRQLVSCNRAAGSMRMIAYGLTQRAKDGRVLLPELRVTRPSE